MIISINGKEHPYRFGWGALLLAEELLGKPWGEVVNTRSNFVLWYCCFVNADADFPYTFEQLLECCDEDASLVGAMRDAHAEQMSRWGKKSADECDDKKKG